MISDPNVWYTLAFVIFIALMGRSLWRLSSQMLDNKIKSIRKNLEDAARMKKEAKDFLKLAQQKQKAAQEQSHQIMALSEREVERIQIDAIQNRKDFLSSQKRQLQERLASLEVVTFKELNETLIQTAILSAEKVIAQNINPKLNSALIQNRITTAESLRLPVES